MSAWGVSIFQLSALLQDHINNADSVLEWLRKKRGITSIDFMGQVLRNPDNRRHVLGLYWGGGTWNWDTLHLQNPWVGELRSAVVLC